MIVEKVTTTMLALAGKAEFPAHDKEWWIELFNDPVTVNQLLVRICSSLQSRDEDMCKLVRIVYNHIENQYENLR